MRKTISVLLLMLSMSQLYTNNAVHADTAVSANPATVYLDGRQLQLGVNPLFVNNTVLVPMRPIFEGQGAKLFWNGNTKTVTAIKDNIALSYHIGDYTANVNGQSVNMDVPGGIFNGSTLVPLRFVSEALGSTVQWDAINRRITINSPVKLDLNTTILSKVNLRSKPEVTTSSSTGEMLNKGDKVHVVKEVDAFWLEVVTSDDKIGYISAKPGFSDYSSDTLMSRQGDALIAFGQKYLNTPYEFGAAADQTKTFDCSSFVNHVFKSQLSVELPRVSYNQAKEGREVSLNELRKGDLLFFSARGLDIGHVAIYAGNNTLLHTYSKEKGVHFEEFSEKWHKRFVTARRIL